MVPYYRLWNWFIRNDLHWLASLMAPFLIISVSVLFILIKKYWRHRETFKFKCVLRTYTADSTYPILPISHISAAVLERCHYANMFELTFYLISAVFTWPIFVVHHVAIIPMWCSDTYNGLGLPLCTILILDPIKSMEPFIFLWKAFSRNFGHVERRNFPYSCQYCRGLCASVE